MLLLVDYFVKGPFAEPGMEEMRLRQKRLVASGLSGDCQPLDYGGIGVAVVIREAIVTDTKASVVVFG